MEERGKWFCQAELPCLILTLILDHPRFKMETHVKEIVRPMEEVSAGLYDANEGNDEERHELEHGADLADPGGQVDVAALLPIKHLGHEARLEGDH